MGGGLKYQGKVWIATPFYNIQAYSPYIQSLVYTVRMMEKLKVNFEYMALHGDSYVHRARNTLCAKFLESDATDLFFIDSDEEWDVTGFFRVLTSEKEVVGGSYKMKNNWSDWTAKLKMKENRPIGIMQGASALLEAEFIPCGFMRIKRTALERMSIVCDKYLDHGADPLKPDREYTAFFDTSTDGSVFKGEDFTFCKKWQSLGGQIWVEPNVSITHFGMSGYNGNLDKHLRGLNGKEVASTTA